MKDMIIAKLQETVGLSEDQAKQAADVVMNLIETHGGDLAKMATNLTGGGGGGAADAISGALGGLMGGGDD